ncbi:MAG: cysteine desulfurase [Gemmatimonadales bacterium]|nr:MAG: cysteine desulfurase [Gemmatimonadales bacterium]
MLYLDHAATSPLRPDVLAAMEEARGVAWANPSARHEPGRRARRTLDDARERVASILGCSPREVYFVRGGTEANNLAIQGLWRRAARPSEAAPPGGLVISALEHSSVSEPADALEAMGVEVTRLGIRPDGTLAEDALNEALSAHPFLVSVQGVNSVTGLLLPLEPVLRATSARGIPVHIDAVQAIGRVPLPPLRDPLSPVLMTLSGHKLGGPRGSAVLTVPRSVAPLPLLFGGGQERGLRPGTEDVEAAVGLATALSIAVDTRTSESERLTALRVRLETRLLEALPMIRVHAAQGPRAPHILHLGIPGLDSELLLTALDMEGVAASAGSACRSGVPGPGPTLEALYGEAAGNHASLRLSLGWNTTAAEVEEAGTRIASVIARMLEFEGNARETSVGNQGR